MAEGWRAGGGIAGAGPRGADASFAAGRPVRLPHPSFVNQAGAAFKANALSSRLMSHAQCLKSLAWPE